MTVLLPTTGKCLVKQKMEILHWYRTGTVICCKICFGLPGLQWLSKALNADKSAIILAPEVRSRHTGKDFHRNNEFYRSQISVAAEQNAFSLKLHVAITCTCVDQQTKLTRASPAEFFLIPVEIAPLLCAVILLMQCCLTSGMRTHATLQTLSNTYLKKKAALDLVINVHMSYQQSRFAAKSYCHYHLSLTSFIQT